MYDTVYIACDIVVRYRMRYKRYRILGISHAISQCDIACDIPYVVYDIALGNNPDGGSARKRSSADSGWQPAHRLRLSLSRRPGCRLLRRRSTGRGHGHGTTVLKPASELLVRLFKFLWELQVQVQLQVELGLNFSGPGDALATGSSP